MNGNKPYWLDDPINVNRVCYALYALCALLMLADLLDHRHPHFAVDAWFGFYGLFGFISCVLLVVVAKLLRKVIYRGEDYYDREEDGHVR